MWQSNRSTLMILFFPTILIVAITNLFLGTSASAAKKRPEDARPPSFNSYCFASPGPGSPQNPPTPFLYQPFSTAASLGDIWVTQMDHEKPNYKRDGILSTLGERLSYSDHRPKDASDTREPLIGGTQALDNSKNYRYYDYTVLPTEIPSSILAYQSPSIESFMFYDGHDGNDFAVAGDALAAASGTVVFADIHPSGLGRVVEIYHPEGYLTRYAHLASFFVKAGDIVHTGEPIGKIGGSAYVDGGLRDNQWQVHLHFSVFRWNADREEWEITDPFGWDPWQGTIAQAKDPLISCNGEISYVLWFGRWPTPYGKVTIGKPERPSKDRYVGGFLGNETYESSIGTDAVWLSSPEAFDKVQACGVDTQNKCILAIMRETGASPQAITLAEQIGNDGYLADFKEMGRVDIGTITYPLAANGNFGNPVLLNGIPSIILVNDRITEDELSGNLDMRSDPTYSSLANQFPQVTRDPVTAFETMQQLASGGQRFIFTARLLNGCHGCEQVGTAHLALDFDETGKFLGAKLVSIELVGTSVPPKQETTRPSPQQKQVCYANTCFSYEAFATNVAGKTIPEQKQDQDVPFWQILPEYTKFQFEGYKVESRLTPELDIFPVKDLIVKIGSDDPSINTLKTLLSNRSTLAAHVTLGGNALPPFLPPLNAGMVFASNIQYVDFGNGSGIRYITGFSQALGLVDLNGIFYTFQGVTDDGTYYVSARFPVSVTLSPNTPPVEDGSSGNSDETLAYDRMMVEQLDQLSNTVYRPTLDVLDDLVRSLNINSLEPLPLRATTTNDGKVYLGEPLILDTQQEAPGCSGVGRISYSPTDDYFLVLLECLEGDNEAFIFRADGSDKRRITDEWDYISYDHYEWSPDGEYLTYQRVNSCCAPVPANAPSTGRVRYDVRTGVKTLLDPAESQAPSVAAIVDKGDGSYTLDGDLNCIKRMLAETSASVVVWGDDASHCRGITDGEHSGEVLGELQFAGEINYELNGNEFVLCDYENCIHTYNPNIHRIHGIVKGVCDLYVNRSRQTPSCTTGASMGQPKIVSNDVVACRNAKGKFPLVVSAVEDSPSCLIYPEGNWNGTAFDSFVLNSQAWTWVKEGCEYRLNDDSGDGELKVDYSPKVVRSIVGTVNYVIVSCN